VRVGPQEQNFHIRKALAIHYSGYFRGAFGSDKFKEGETGVLTLPDVDTWVFTIFVDWLCHQELPSRKIWDTRYPCSSPSYPWDGKIIPRCYVFADRFIIPDMTQAVMSYAHISYSECPPWYETITFAFSNMSQNDRFLQLLVDAHCTKWNGDDSEESEGDITSLPAAFLH
ncbi:hypothetical protein K504DRAFT_525681, partial [Pleomassaria siparia CBS 279.74]